MKPSFALATLLLSAFVSGTALADPLRQHPSPDAAGFETLYDGKDLSKLRTEGNWQIEPDGALRLTPRDGETGWKRYHHYLWLPGEHGDFTVDFEFQYTEGGNSGLYFRCADDVDPTLSGFEVQILDSYGVEKELGHHDMGGIIKTKGASKNQSKPAGEWNRMTVSMAGDRLVVVLNGECIHDFDLRAAKPADKELAAKGKIAIQDHGQPFAVRNIRLKKS